MMEVMALEERRAFLLGQRDYYSRRVDEVESTIQDRMAAISMLKETVG